VLILTALACSPLAGIAAWVIANVAADKAAEAEWRGIDRAWRTSGRSLPEALSIEVRARQDRVINLPGG
jgi:hypothetical protein